jgi:hypothetical protein
VLRRLPAKRTLISRIFEISDTKGYDPDNYYAKDAGWMGIRGNVRRIIAIGTIIYLEIKGFPSTIW